MGRDYSYKDFIKIPVMKAEEAVVLGTQLVSTFESAQNDQQAAGAPIKEDIVWGYDDLKEATADLNAELTPDLPADTQARTNTDNTLDTAWGGANGWHKAILRLPREKVPNYDSLEQSYTILYSDGLRFLNYTYEVEWQATKTRLDAIAGAYEEAIRTAGGGTFYDAVKEAFIAYGEALGITVEASYELSPAIREKMDAAEDAMRLYLARVAVSPDRRVDGSDALAERLARPYIDWKTSKTGTTSDATTANSEGEETGETAGESTAAGTSTAAESGAAAGTSAGAATGSSAATE